MISRRLVALAAVLLVVGSITLVRAQDSAEPTSSSQSDSLGDAARKARAQKKDPSKPAKVFTNEDVGSLKGTISVIGNEPARGTGTDKAAEKNDDKKPANGADAKPTDVAKKEQAKDEPYWRAKFAAARKTLAEDTKELDILQREFNLKQEQYSQDPNWAMHEQNSRADINKTQSEIDTKKQDIDKDKQAISDLEDELRKAGGDAGWANEPSGPSDSNGSKSAASNS
jgi:chromosome segregation ATPase